MKLRDDFSEEERIMADQLLADEDQYVGDEINHNLVTLQSIPCVENIEASKGVLKDL